MSDTVRRQIVDAAIGLLETSGPKAFGQTRVARAANVQQGHLTYYFPRKADLVSAVLERFADEGRLEFARVVAHASTADPAGLRRAFFDHARTLMKDKKRTRVLLSVMIEAQDHPDLAATLEERSVGQRAIVGMLIGREPHDVDVDIVLGALQGLGIRQLLRPAPADRIDQIIDRLQEWLDALPPRTATPTLRAPRRKATTTAVARKKPRE